MNRKILTIFIAMFLPVMVSALSTKQLAVSINLSGKQRMLTQKMAKEVFLVKAGIDKDKNSKKLQQSRELFDKTLNALTKGDKDLKLKPCKDEKIQKQLKVVKNMWRKYEVDIKKVLSTKADKNTYHNIQVQNLPLLKEINKAVSMYVELSKDKSSKRAQAINLSGKQRMLTQKIAKDLLLISQGLDVKKNSLDLQKTSKLFEQILAGLQKGNKSLKLGGTKLPKIKKQLKVGEKLWYKIKPDFQKSLNDKKLLNKTISNLDTLLVEMNKAVKLFEKSIKREKQALKLSSLVGKFMKKKSEQNHVINLSGKQRMLTQKMTKLSLLISLGLDKEQNKKSLSNASKLYEQTLDGFLNGDKNLNLTATKNSKIINLIKELQKEWSPFSNSIKAVIKSSKKDVKALGYIVKNNEKLLVLSDNLVQAFKKSQTKQTFMEKSRANIIDIAGRQRMLTQKMTKEKLLVLSKVAVEENSKKLQKSIELFDTSLNSLIDGDKKLLIAKPSSKKIVKQLHVVRDMWRELKPLYEKKKLSNKELLKVVKKNPILLSHAHEVVKLSENAVDY